MIKKIIEIKYKDKQNWISVGDESGENKKTVNWDNYSKKYKDESVQPYYVAPLVVPDTWNGKPHEVQHTSWTSYYFEMFLKQSEIHELQKIKSCSDIQIIEYSRTTSGLIITKTYILDLSEPEMLIISEPERVNQTSSWKVSVIFRTDRTVIYKGDSIAQTNELKFTTSEWHKLSSTLPPAGTNIFAAMTSTRIAVMNAGNLQTFDYIAGSWQAVGNALATTYTTQSIAMVSLNIDNVVVFVDTDDKLIKYTFDGTDWLVTGNVFTFAAAKDVPAIAKLDVSTVAVFDATAKVLETYTFDGTDWTKTGNSLAITISSLASIAITGLTTASIAYIDSVNSELRIYDWDGTDWTLDFATAIVIGDNIVMTALTNTEVALLDDDNLTLKQYTSNGTIWSQTLATLALLRDGYNSISTLDQYSVVAGLEEGTIEWLSVGETYINNTNYQEIVALSSTRLAAISWNNITGLLQTYDYNGTNWVTVGNELDTGYATPQRQCIAKLTSTTIAIMNYPSYLDTYTFDGTDWTHVGNPFFILTGEYYNITGLDSTHIALYRTGVNALEVYEWDGTDWAKVGNSFSLVTGVLSYPSMGTLSSTSIVFTDYVTKKLRKYDWDGIDWALDFATDTILVSPSVIALSATEIVVTNTNQPNTLQKYISNGTSWITYGLLLSTYFGNELVKGISTGLDNITIFQGSSFAFQDYELNDVNYNSFDNFESGVYSFFTDFDVIKWNKPTESVNVEWYDKTTRLAQATNKSGYQVLMYMTPEDLDAFMNIYKSSGTMTVNGVAITEPELEQAQIATNYMRVVLRGVSTTITTDFDICPLSTYNLKIVKDTVTTNFYTDYPPELISVTPDIEKISNETGVNTPVKNITKTVKKVKFYLNETNAFNLKNKFELFGTVTLDTVPILESDNVKPNKIGVDLYEVEVDCFIGATVKW